MSRRSPFGPVPPSPLPADLLVIVLTAAATVLGLAAVAAVIVITLSAGETDVFAVVAGLPPAVMSPFTVALPAVIRVAQAERAPRRRGRGRPASGRPRARCAPPGAQRRSLGGCRGDDDGSPGGNDRPYR
ncbi:hypothetical protein [Frankia sp. QA3]|uniref:hypothetical protein n=1 Tax=Frankia sp. QA3 TaxID=710111 RepID=UPI000269BD4F|nr:hypothetical protein [Frankia sp. QA3]EIV92277.1 hypothetical protein FraQA3DRAFT_1810 [Frankia sp. QA3]